MLALKRTLLSEEATASRLKTVAIFDTIGPTA